MKTHIIAIIIITCMLLKGCVTLNGANAEQLVSKLEEKDPKLLKEKGSQLEQDSLKNNWPPPNPHRMGSLGFALQNKFKSQCDFCGFVFDTKDKDYVPLDIKRFIPMEKLSLPAEIADIEGASILFYMFSDSEIKQTFDKRYSASRIFEIQNLPQFNISTSPNPHLDNWLLTKTCNGFINASLIAGIKPPYSSFELAARNDSKKESAIIAISGTFESPLKKLFSNNDSKTYAYLQLWKKYLDNNKLINNAYYLREFEGIMIKRTATAEEFSSLEAAGKLDFTGPLSTKVQGEIGLGLSSSNLFKATDWETIILTKFDEAYIREKLFDNYPTINMITNHFNSLTPTYETPSSMVQGVINEVVVSLDNLPGEMSDKDFWKIESWPNEIYRNHPILDTEIENSRTKFIIKGTPKNELFNNDNNVIEVDAKFKIRSKDGITVDNKKFYLEFNIETIIPFSKEPEPLLPENAFFEPYRINQNGENFGIKWTFDINFRDVNNPVDFQRKGELSNVSLRNMSGNNIPVRYEISTNEAEKKYQVFIYDSTPFELKQISNKNNGYFNFEAVLIVPLRRRPSNSRVEKTIRIPFPYPEFLLDN